MMNFDHYEGKPRKNNPNLSDELNRNIAQSEIEGGVYLNNLKVGAILHVRTKNTLYVIEKVDDGYMISGNPKYCPEPLLTYIQGSTWGGSMLKVGFVGRGMRLEFSDPRYGPRYAKGCVTTSEILEITEVQ